MSEWYVSSDYAGLSGGNYSFYYGYESALPVDSDCCDEPCTCDSPWRFTVSKGGVEVWSSTAEELGEESSECARVLMAGIGAWFDYATNQSKSKKND